MSFQGDCAKRFEESAKRLVRLLELNAPDVILAGVVARLWECAEGAFGKELYKEVLKHKHSALRDQMGFCQDCDNEIAAFLTHPPYCEHCDARIETEVDKMEKDAGLE